MMAHIMKRASHMDRGPLIHMTIVFITCVPKNQFLYWWHVARPNIWWCRDTQISRKRMAVWFPAVKSPLYLTCNLLGGLLPSVLWRWHVNLVSQGKGGGVRPPLLHWKHHHEIGQKYILHIDNAWTPNLNMVNPLVNGLVDCYIAINITVNYKVAVDTAIGYKRKK